LVLLSVLSNNSNCVSRGSIKIIKCCTTGYSIFAVAYERKTKGAAALVTMILIGSVVVEIGIVGLFIVYLMGQSSFGARASAEAYLGAQAGIDDALIKIVRNKDVDYTSSGSPYSMLVNRAFVKVSIYKDAIDNIPGPPTFSPGKNELYATGSLLNKNRELKAVLNIDPITGQVQVKSIEEIIYSPL